MEQQMEVKGASLKPHRNKVPHQDKVRHHSRHEWQKRFLCQLSLKAWMRHALSARMPSNMASVSAGCNADTCSTHSVGKMRSEHTTQQCQLQHLLLHVVFLAPIVVEQAL